MSTRQNMILAWGVALLGVAFGLATYEAWQVFVALMAAHAMVR